MTYGWKKPKLESISIPKWVVVNTRNFYAFLSEDKLSTQSAIQDYLAYTVKTMELIARFDWKSIFMYNNEFKKLQAILTPHICIWFYFSQNINLTQPQSLLNHLLLLPTSRPHLPALRQMVGLYAAIFTGSRVVHSWIVILPMFVIVRLPGRLVQCLTLGSFTKLSSLHARKHCNDYPHVS